jgi:CRP/FNR family transcriptional regulator, cyclic AMP receptor protein
MAVQLSLYELFNKIPLFKNLCIDEMKPIVEMAESRSYHVGHHVFFQGDEIKNVYFVHSGKVKIYKTDVSGKEHIVHIMQPGNMFPHAGFFRQDTAPANAEIIENAVLIYIPIHAFEQFLITNPSVCIKVFRVLGDKIVDLQKRLEEKVLHSTYEQIIMLLLRLIKSHGRELHNGKVVFNMHFTNRQLADMIGSSRETVSRTLTQLKKEGIIETTSTGELVLDPILLEEQIV